MTFIDSSAVNVALPSIQRDLQTDATNLQWVVEGYSLFLSALILIGGSLGDVFGRRRIFIAGIALFALASLACAGAQTILALNIARCVQGIGGALATPGSLALISANVGPANRGRAIGTWSGFASITAAIGPLLGGWLAQNASWRYVFIINVPLAVFVILAALWRVPESRDSNSRRIDGLGATLATLSLGLLTFGLITLQKGRPYNTNAGGSFVQEGRQQINVRELGLFRNVNDIGETFVKNVNGTALRIKDIGYIQQGPKIRLGQIAKSIHRKDGVVVDNPDTVEGIVLLRKGADTETMLNLLHAKVDDLNDHFLPPGVKIVPFLDRSAFGEVHHDNGDAQLERRNHPCLYHSICVFGQYSRFDYCRAYNSFRVVVRFDLPRLESHTGEFAIAGCVGFWHGCRRRSRHGREHSSTHGAT